MRIEERPKSSPETTEITPRPQWGLFDLPDVFVSKMNIWDSDVDLAHECEVLVLGKVTISLFYSFQRKILLIKFFQRPVLTYELHSRFYNSGLHMDVAIS